MKAPTPKQYLPLHGKPIILRALDALLSYSLWQEVIVVCDPDYRSVFASYDHLRFALPGKQRQDSVFSGLDQLSPSIQWVCIHDGARPLLAKEDLLSVIEAGKQYGAAALATPVNATIKEVDSDLFVKRTVPRELLWSIQTPQVLSVDLLKKGRAFVEKNNLTVTDDVSLAEIISHPVKLVKGSESNIKITTKEDLALATTLYE